MPQQSPNFVIVESFEEERIFISNPDAPNGRGGLLRIPSVGLNDADKQSSAADYGVAPHGCNDLTIGHQDFGRVQDVDANLAVLLLEP